MKKYASVGLLSLSLVLANVAGAANPVSGAAGAVMERDIQQRQQQDMERRIEEQQRLQPAGETIRDETVTPEPTPAPGREARLDVTRIMVTESSILTEQEIHNIVSPLEGRRVALQEIFDAIDEINRLYEERKFLAAKAILPPQKVVNGVVLIRLVEGRIGDVSVLDNASTDDAFIVDRLDAASGELVEIGRLEESLFYFNAVNDVQLRAVLKPGELPGTTDYVIHTVEPDRYDSYLFLDNAGTRDVGRERLGFSFVDRSLTGQRDSLSLGGYVAEGTRSAYLAYNRHVSHQGTRLALSVDYSDIDIVDGPLEPLNVTGSSYNFGVFVSHPLIVSRQLLLNGFGGLNIKRSTTDFDDVTLFETDVRTVSLGFDAQSSDTGTSWYTRHFVTMALESWGNTKDFLRYNGEGSWLKALNNGNSLLLRGRLQLANKDLLPTSEQIQVGGMSTVRGYSEGLLIGDDGYFVSAEFGFPLSSSGTTNPDSPFGGRWRGFVFFDTGAAFPFKGNNQGIDSDDFLASVGAGLSIDLGRQLRGRLVAGVPIISRDDNADEPRMHFYLQSMPF